MDTGRRLTFELLVIFLGVYAAFWVENYRGEIADRERSREVVQTIQRGLDDIINVQSEAAEASLLGLSEWQSARERGELPPPYFLRMYGSERAPRTVYEAILQSRPVELFSPDLMFDLAFLYSEVMGVSDRYVRYSEFTESKVLPNLKNGPLAFYDSTGQTLLPNYAAHMDRLQELAEMWLDQVDQAKAMKERLSREIEG